MSQTIILVNAGDQAIGVANKMDAHVHGWCHRAFSIQLFARENDQVFALLQQRARHKYHCGGLWSNSCCSHFAPQKPVEAQLAVRLQQELGLHDVVLTKQAAFHYRAVLPNGLIEDEYDHVYVGWLDRQNVPFNTSEVMACRWVACTTLKTWLAQSPSDFTPWCAAVLRHAMAL